MGILGRIKRHKFFRYDLFMNTGDAWKQFGEGLKEYLDYKDIENPDPGAILRLYGVYNDKAQKDGWGREMLWEKAVPMPGGGKAAGSKKEKPIEERLMEKLLDGADFSGLRPNKMSIPLGKSGGSLEFESPVTIPAGDGNGKGYMVIDGNRYPIGDMGALEFEGKLPAWLHPAAGALITGLMDRAAGFFKSSVGDAITETTGIRVKNKSGNDNTTGQKIEEPPDAVAQLDSLLLEPDDNHVYSHKSDMDKNKNKKKDDAEPEDKDKNKNKKKEDEK